MWKFALIAWIIFIVLKKLLDIVIGGMSVEEKLSCTVKNEIPLRVMVFCGITILEFIAAVILTIVTIIKW